MKFKRYLSIIISVMLLSELVPLFSLTANADFFTVGILAKSDDSVYAPGVFDIYVTTNAEEPTYCWMACVGQGGGASGYVALSDNENYTGVYTSHLSLKTHDGIAYTDDGTGWDNIYFSCAVTDKSGKTRQSPAMNMIIFTHQSLLNALEKNNIKITYFTASNSIASREIEGVSYSDCYLDHGIRFSYLYSDIKDGAFKNRFEDSECELRTEILVKENNKTTVCDINDTYMPQKTGMGEVLVTGNLVLYVDGERMETIDTKSFVVNVLTPKGIGTAVVKSNTAILEERYSQARVLARLEKGEYVRLISDEGGYWKAAAHGVMGYIPTTSLNITERINVVSLNITEPNAYAKSGNTVTLEEGANYKAESSFNKQIWHDDTDNRFLEYNDVFLPGHNYTLQVWLTADDGKSFSVNGSNPDVASFVNGKAATTYKAFEQDPENVIEVSYKFDHVHELTKINKVNPTCETDGKQSYYKCCGCGWRFEDSRAKVLIADENWGIIPALGHNFSKYGYDENDHWQACALCGERRSQENHVFNNSGTCNVCGYSKTTKKGDCNKDGKVNNKDVVVLFRYVSVDGTYNVIYDFNEDGKVNNKDVVALFRSINS